MKATEDNHHAAVWRFGKTLTNPKTYTPPGASNTKAFRLLPDWEIGEDLCMLSEGEFFNRMIRDPAAGVVHQ